MIEIRRLQTHRVRFTLAVALLLVSGVQLALAQAQPQSQPGKTARAAPAAANYHGVNKLLPTNDLMAGRRRFEAGAHTAWHIHPAGQLIFVEEGVAVVQRRGEAVKVLHKGESDFTPAGVPHWHGAAPDQHAVMAMVNFGGIGPWLDPVTDADYAAATKRLATTAVHSEQARATTDAPAAGTQDRHYLGNTGRMPTDDLQIARGRFEAGAHTNWHVHPKGQIVFAEEGPIFVQHRGEPVKILQTGESDFTPPGVAHWHGAGPDKHAIKVVVGFGAPTQWLEPVTDAEHEAMIEAFE